MANTRISDLTASASNLASTDLAPVVQTAGVGPVKMTGLQLAAGLLSATMPIGSDPILSHGGSATLQLGAADTTGTTAPTAQFLRVQSWSSSTNNNQTGANFTIQGSRGTGTGAGGSIIFQVAPASGSSNGVQNAYSTALTIDSTRQSTFAGNLIFGTDNTYDIGASGTSRPRNVYVGSKVLVQKANSEVTAPYIGISRNIDGGASLAYLAADGATSGNLVLYNGATDNFGRLQFGGTSSSFPALKRSSASLICRLADDTANAAFESASVKTDAPSGGTSGTWKLGVRVAATTTLDTTQYIEVDVGGTLYKLAVVTS